MNRPAELITNGAAKRLSRLYRPGAINAHTWYRIQGEATKIAHRMGIQNQITLKPSMGVIVCSNGGLTPRAVNAETAGSLTTFQTAFENVRQMRKATRSPSRDLMMRERSSCR